MADLSFDKLPEAVNTLSHKLDCLQREISRVNKPAEEDKWMDLQALIEYLPINKSKNTIYGKVQRREIPFYKKGQELYFLKSEIDLWLKDGRLHTKSEIEDFADGLESDKLVA